MEPTHPTPYRYKRRLEDLLNLKRSAFHNYIRAAQLESFSWRNAHKPFFDPLRAFYNTMYFVLSYLKYRIGLRHRFLDYSRETVKGVYPLGDELARDGKRSREEEIRVSLAGDWGSATLEADRVGDGIRAFNPHFTVHLGDIYHVGDSNAVQVGCLGNPQGKKIRAVSWPHGSRGSFALNGNHEMYANGHGYFEDFLPSLGMMDGWSFKPAGQKASFFALKNRFWILVGLDTGYNSVGIPILEKIAYVRKIPPLGGNRSLPSQVVEWFAEEVSPEQEGRGMILLSHHQYCSAFEGRHAKAGKQLHGLIRKPVLWFWGHEHRMALYGRAHAKHGIEAYGRCLGHGGMPVNIHAKPKLNSKKNPLVFYDDRVYRHVSGTPVGLNGYANLTFQGPRLTIEYRDIREGDNLVLIESWEVCDGLLQGVDIQMHCMDKGLLLCRQDLRQAIGLQASPHPSRVLV